MNYLEYINKLVRYINKIDNLKYYLLSYLVTVLIALIFLHPSFSLAFSDDDWYTILLHRINSGLNLFSPYGVQWWFFGTLYKYIGPTYYTYFIIAFIFRSLAALSILYFINSLTKNRILAILGGVMFSIGFTGIQTSFEPVNMNVYISIVGYMIFLTFFYLTRENFSIINLILMGTFLLFASLISPVRTYPIYVWAIIVDIFWFWKNFTKDKTRKLLIRQSIIIFLFLFLNHMGTFIWKVPENISSHNSYLDRFNSYLSQNINALMNLDLTLIYNLLTGIGATILPNKENVPPNINTFIGIIYIILIIAFFLKRRRNNSLPLFDFLLWVPILYIGYSVIITIDPALMPLIYSPMRYLLPVYIGFIISFVLFIQFIMEKRSLMLNFLLFSMTGLLITIHSINLYTYLKDLSETRDGFYNEKIWKEMKIHVPKLDLSSGKPSIFYFETDRSSRATYTISGSGRQYIILYEIPQFPEPQITPYNPMAFYTFEGLMLALTGKFQGVDSKISPSKPPPWERIYAFRIEKDKLINISNNLRENVEKILSTQQNKFNTN